MGGVDFGHEVFTPYDAIVVGLMGGYIASDLHFKQFPTSFDMTGATFGASASYLVGGFFIDGLFKVDLLDAALNFPSLAPFGFSGADVKVRNIGGLGNIGYRWDSHWGLGILYFEPIGTVSFVSTHIDGFASPGLNVAFGAGEALRGGVGLRIGDVWVNTPAWEVDTSVTGKAWDQFITKNGVTLETLGGDVVIDDLYKKVFGEVVTQINITQKGSGVSAYMSGGVKFNSDFTVYTGKGGVRYQW